MPTVHDLDAATTTHPVLARRRGHLAIANSLALQRAGITKDTPNPSGGTIKPGADRYLNGIVEGGAVYIFSRVIPPQPFKQQLASIEQASKAYAAVGLGAVRDPIVMRDDLPLYQAAQERGGLSTRCRLMLLISPAGSVADRIKRIEGYGVRSGFGDDWLRLWGLKFVIDGGPEGGALDAPYANDPTHTGHLNWDPEEMVSVASAAVKRGWKIGTHAIGDRAVRTLLDVYERVTRPILASHQALSSLNMVSSLMQLSVPRYQAGRLRHRPASTALRAWGMTSALGARAYPFDYAGQELARGGRAVVRGHRLSNQFV